MSRAGRCAVNPRTPCVSPPPSRPDQNFSGSVFHPIRNSTPRLQTNEGPLAAVRHYRLPPCRGSAQPLASWRVRHGPLPGSRSVRSGLSRAPPRGPGCGRGPLHAVNATRGRSFLSASGAEGRRAELGGCCCRAGRGARRRAWALLRGLLGVGAARLPFLGASGAGETGLGSFGRGEPPDREGEVDGAAVRCFIVSEEAGRL